MYLPNIVSWTGTEIFNGSLIENLVLPKATLTNTNINYLFTNLLKLKRIIVSSIQSFGGNPIFSNNNIVEIIDCFSPCDTSFAISALLSSLKTWIIRKDTKIANMANLVNMPNLEEVYVPQVLLETYKTATNWSTYADKFKPLEGSKYESLTWYESEDWYREEMSVWQ